MYDGPFIIPVPIEFKFLFCFDLYENGCTVHIPNFFGFKSSKSLFTLDLFKLDSLF